MAIIATYGSLRPGHYNYERFFNDNNHEILADNVILPDYALYSLGPYPAIIEDTTSSVLVTLIEVKDIRDVATIDDMERGAGYRSVTLKEFNGFKNVKFYVYNNTDIEQYCVKVHDGNWTNFVKEQK